MSIEHFDDAPYNQGDISEQRIAREPWTIERQARDDRERRFKDWLAYVLSDEPEQTSAALNEWQTSNPRFWE